MKYNIALIFLLLPFFSHAQQDCNLVLSGKVVDADDKEIMPFVAIYIKELSKGVVSDDNGQYVFPDLCAGTYTIECNHIGCNHFTTLVNINKNTVLNLSLHHNNTVLEEVVISEKETLLPKTQSEDAVDKETLIATKGQGLADILKNIPGVNILSTGPSIAKPIIQGLHSDRVPILNNGMRQEGQQWGLEHAPEIDPLSADKISIIKGASSVRYGIGAIGGVVLVTPKPLRDSAGIGGGLSHAAFSNGQQGVASAMLESLVSERFPLQFRIQGTLKRGGNIRTPNYYLDNTGVSEQNYSWSLAYRWKKNIKTVLNYSRFQTAIGIFTGSHIGNLTDLENAINAKEPLLKSDFSYNLKRPLQNVVHEALQFKSSFPALGGTLETQLAYQFNKRKEYDAHKAFGAAPDDLLIPEMLFQLKSYSANIFWKHPQFYRFRGSIGVDGLLQKNLVGRGGLIPQYDAYSAGVYWIEHWRNYPFPWDFEYGVRYDYKWMNPVLYAPFGNIKTPLTFGNFSGTLGATWQAKEHLQLVFNTGTAWRAPNVNELYSDGVHHGTATFERGDPYLKSEKAWNTSIEINFQHHNYGIKINTYHNFIRDFIYLTPDSMPVLTVRGAFPAFHYEQADVRMLGADAEFNWQPFQKIIWNMKGSYLLARNLNSHDYLILMPANRIASEWRYNFANYKKINQPYFLIGLQHVFKQDKTPQNKLDYAPAPEAYTLANIRLGAHFNIGNLSLDGSVSVDNLLNESYRDYLDRFRYFTDAMGRNISLRLNCVF